MTFEQYWEKKGHFGSNPEDVARLAWDAAVSEDSKRLNWLERQNVEVRGDDGNLRFWRSSSPKASPLRQYIDDSRECEGSPLEAAK